MTLHNLQAPFQWECPVCGRGSVITKASFDSDNLILRPQAGRREDRVWIDAAVIVCPNAECGESNVIVEAHWANHLDDGSFQMETERPLGIGKFTFAPTIAKPLSETVPKHIQEDFCEAHLIRQLSPKASATLARRALQGMIRHRWNVVKDTLHKEILGIKEHCDEDLYAAMMGLKAIGNIGAHPEKDAAIVVDVEEGEADELLELLLILDEDWYVSRARRNRNLAAVAALAAKKELEKGGA